MADAEVDIDEPQIEEKGTGKDPKKKI